jgi:hypothetical protein
VGPAERKVKRAVTDLEINVDEEEDVVARFPG